MSQDEFSLVMFDRYISGILSVKTKDESNVGICVVRLFLKMLEYSGHGIPWITATLYLAYASAGIGTRLFFCNLLMALILDLAIVGALKTIFRRPRPVYNIDDMFATVSVDRYSFPSGHSTRVTMVAALLTHYWRNSLYINLGYVWAAMVAISRVVLGRHHVSDIIGGVFIGYLQYLLVMKYRLNQESLEKIINTLSV